MATKIGNYSKLRILIKLINYFPKIDENINMDLKIQKDVLPSNKILRNSLRVLQPEEIAELTLEFVSFNKVKLTEILDEEFNVTTPINMESKATSAVGVNILADTAVPIGPVANGNVISLRGTQDSLKVMGNLATKWEPENLRELQPENAAESHEPFSGGKFILEQKAKFRESNIKLKKNDLFRLYERNAEVDIATEKLKSQKSKVDEEISSNSQIGTLVNRKHY